RGISITEYCDLIRASIRERLQLFMQVCQAIQHAHHKGVMHRDIKPSNVLVTMHDGQPVVKVIDFGIAKATQGPLSERTCHTALEQLIGTPAYISPEQTELGQRTVDARSDLYSLGVLLYELLTGCTPLDTEDLLRSNPEEMRRRVREEEPPTPSARLKALRRSSTETQGDLDWIVMRCLEKEPHRRYQAATNLLLDIHRYLHHETVDARPPSVGYTLRKFARRNRTMFAAMLAAGVFAIAFAVNTSIQARRVSAERQRVEQQRQRAEKVAGFILETLARTEPFGYADIGRPETAKELLDRADAWLRQDTSQDPELRARLLESIASAYSRRGDYRRAVGLLSEALDLRRQLSGGADDLDTARLMNELAPKVRWGGDLATADGLLQDAAAMLKRLGEERSYVYARVLMNRGRLEMRRANPEAAAKYADHSLALLRELRGPRDIAVAEALVDKAHALNWQENQSVAEEAARQAVDIYKALPQLHPDRLYAEGALAEILRERRKFAEADVILREQLIAHRQIYGENNRYTASVLDSQARIAWGERRLAEAEDLARQALDRMIKAEGMNHYETGYVRTTLGAIQTERGKYTEAEVQWRAALAVFEKLSPADHPHRAAAEYWLGVVLVATQRSAEAEPYFRAAMSRAERAGEAPWRIARIASGLGEALHVQGRAREAESYLVSSYRTISTSQHADTRTKEVARDRVMRFYNENGQPADRMLRVDADP
ncbi:MAG TPA: tetratricopeptide repeat protein, partial [Steroidobacteraceae bacterium]|nr:tetratricopeptide repeat protein [Steroidobacteraceae bacterium]